MEHENNTGWLDVTAAAALVGRSVSTIRRLLPDIPETALKKEPLAGQGGYKVLVARKWLLDHFGQKEIYHAVLETSAGGLSALEKQLEQKDKQIEHLQRDGEAKTRQLETAHQHIAELTSNVQQLAAVNAGLQSKMLQLVERVGDRADRPTPTGSATQAPAYWVAVAVLLSLIAGLAIYLLMQWLGNG